MLRPNDYERLTRQRRDAGSRACRTTARLAAAAREDGRPAALFLIGYEAERLLGDLLDAAETLAGLLPLPQDDYSGADIEMFVEKAEAVQARLLKRRQIQRRLRLAEKLADTRGRTPEEAAAFQQAARRMLLGDGS